MPCGGGGCVSEGNGLPECVLLCTPAADEIFRAIQILGAVMLAALGGAGYYFGTSVSISGLSSSSRGAFQNSIRYSSETSIPPLQSG